MGTGIGKLFTVLGVLISLLTAPCRAEIHKWVDEHGQVHYEDSPKGSGSAVKQPASTVEPGESPLSPEQERLQKQKRVLEAIESERQSRQQVKEKADKQRREAAAKCEVAQQQLQTRENARYLYRKGKDGERDIFSEEERAKSVAEARNAVKRWCK